MTSNLFSELKSFCKFLLFWNRKRHTNVNEIMYSNKSLCLDDRPISLIKHETPILIDNESVRIRTIDKFLSKYNMEPSFKCQIIIKNKLKM
jgi:hypothetical protein